MVNRGLPLCLTNDGKRSALRNLTLTMVSFPPGILNSLRSNRKRGIGTRQLCGVLSSGFYLSLLLLVLIGPEPASIVLKSNANNQIELQVSPGSSVNREIAGNIKEQFQIRVEQGQLLRFSIDKGDLVLSTQLYGPTLKQLVASTSQELERVEISFPADVGGTYLIEVQSYETTDISRPYELRVEALTNSTALDRKVSEAQQLIAEAGTLKSRGYMPELREALAKYDKAALMWVSISNFSSAAQATLNAGDICFVLSDFREALKRYENARTLAEKNGDRLLQGKALSHMGLVETYLGNNDRAQKQLNQASDLLKTGEKDPNPITRSAYGEALVNMAEVSYAKGNFPKAFDQVKAALKVLDQDRKIQARAHRFAGYLTGSLGDAKGAEAEISRALELSRAINDRIGEGLANTLLGLFYSITGKVDKAFPLHRQAIEIFRSAGDRHSEAIALNGVGQASEKQSEFIHALNNYEDALRIFENIGAQDMVAVSTFKLAKMYNRQGDHERALLYLDRCLKLSRAAGKQRNEANALAEVAVVYASQKRPDEAAKRYRKAQDFYETIGDLRGQLVAANTYGGVVLFGLGQTQQALAVLNQVLPLSEKVGDKEILTTTIYHLARLHHALNNDEAALAYIERSIKIIEDLRAGAGSPELRASFFSGVRRHYDLCIAIRMQLDHTRPGNGYSARAFLVSEKSRARSLLDLVNESQIKLRQGATADLLRRESEVGNSFRLLAEYERDLSSNKKRDPVEAAEVATRLIDLRARYQEIQAELRTHNSKQSPLTGFEFKDVGEVQQGLRGDTMLLEYSLGDERSYLWAVTSSSFHGFELPKRATLEGAVKELYDVIIARQKLDTQTGADYQANVAAADQQVEAKTAGLGQLLLGPVAEQLGNKRLVFVTEGALQLTPFEALTLPNQAAGPAGRKPFLIETNEVVVALSMSTLITIRTTEDRRASPGKVVAVIADPVYSANDERVQKQGQSAEVAYAATAPGQPAEENIVLDGSPARLVHSSTEADAISAAAPRGTSLVAKGFDASRETAMNSQLGEYQIIHFATHGVVNSEHPELSAIVLATVDQNGVRKNGLMSLYDIYNLDLSADLTVLSACQTALGKDIKGEGLVGLTHSFMSAGSKSVVASLWKVDDRATAHLMEDFYQSMLRKGIAPSTALRKAKLKMIENKRWSEPYYWAGFVFQGDYESRIEVQSNTHLALGLALLAVVLASLGLMLLLRRRRQSTVAKQKF